MIILISVEAEEVPAEDCRIFIALCIESAMSLRHQVISLYKGFRFASISSITEGSYTDPTTATRPSQSRA